MSGPGDEAPAGFPLDGFPEALVNNAPRLGRSLVHRGPDRPADVPFQLDRPGETDYARLGQFNRCFDIDLPSPTRRGHGNSPPSRSNAPARRALERSELESGCK